MRLFVRRGAGGAGPSTTPISGGAARPGRRWFLVVLFACFALAGGAVLLFVFVPMYREYRDAQAWIPTPCTIVESAIRSHEDSDGITYSIHLLFEYEAGGRTYRSDRYHFMGGFSSSGYAGKRAFVDRYPPGAKAVCYVNPKDPRAAVFDRGFAAEYLIALLPLVFLLVGGIGLAVVLRRPRRVPAAPAGSTAGAPGTAGVPSAPAPAAGPVVLRPKTPPWLKAVGLLCAALFWNGVVSIFVWQVVSSWGQGSFEWFLAVFLIPFVLVGLGLVVGVVYQVLACFNPRPVITAGAAAVPHGGSVEIAWKVPGLDRRIKRLRIRLEGCETATYRRGTDTCTDRNVFAAVDLVDTRSPYEIRAGRATLAVPAGLMHSFEARHNTVVWTLQVWGEIDRWPDVNDAYPIAVLPAKT